MIWVREDSNTTNFYDSPKVAIENSPGMSVLTIMSVNQRFTGAYSCHARNKVGEQQMMTMLNVDVPPTILSAQKETEMRAKSGEDVIFNCHAAGDPQPSYTWTHNGVVVTNSNHYTGKVYLLNMI